MESSTSSAQKIPEAETTPLSYQLAKASWIAPLLVFGVNVLLRGMDPGDASGSRAVVVSIVAVVLYSSGLLCGFVALFGIPKLGWRHILIPALVGIVLNGVILAIFGFVTLNAIRG